MQKFYSIFKTVFAVVLVSSLTVFCAEKESVQIELKNIPAEKRVDVYAGGSLFTSYLYTDEIDVLKKPVLFPINTASGKAITRAFPLQPTPGERVDHPHHIGYWLNYGDVNGLDFWNNSNAIPDDRKAQMGTIRHNQIIEIKNNKLVVSADWLNSDGSKLLTEKTTLVFHAGPSLRIIDRITTLTALDDSVTFTDNKEGMVGLRVTRALEHPSDNPITLTDANGIATEVPVMDNSMVSGNYLNAEGIEGLETWGKRSPWVSLRGRLGEETVNVVIMDHPDNVGYPTYWHARGYGLFAANPLGQKVFSNGKEELNFALAPKSSITFQYRLCIISEDLSRDQLAEQYQNFLNEVLNNQKAIDND